MLAAFEVEKESVPFSQMGQGVMLAAFEVEKESVPFS